MDPAAGPARVRDIMTARVVTASPDTPAPEVARLMQAHDIGAVPVVDEGGALAGIITESDFVGVERCIPFTLELAPVIFRARAATLEELRRIYEDVRLLRAKDIMTERPFTAGEDEEVGALLRAMLSRGLRHVPVVRGGRLVGIVARHDVLKLVAGLA